MLGEEGGLMLVENNELGLEGGVFILVIIGVLALGLGVMAGGLLTASTVKLMLRTFFICWFNVLI